MCDSLYKVGLDTIDHNRINVYNMHLIDPLFNMRQYDEWPMLYGVLANPHGNEKS